MARITPPEIVAKKQNGEKITMLTAYDYSMAAMIDQAGVDMILVGDSLGMVVLGYESTVPVTMEEMLHHAKAVSRGARQALVVGDMPFMSYQVNPEDAVKNAGRFIKEAGCQAIKLEGGIEQAQTIEAIVKAGIPVVGHIGLTPQTATALGGYKLQAKDAESARKLLDDGRAVAEAGAFALVIECVPSGIGKAVSESVHIPTIGIGAGPHCDGQVLVTNDLLGMFEKFTPKFVKKFADLSPIIKDAFSRYVDEVKSGEFPDEEHSFPGGDSLLQSYDA